jgi:cytochrome c-type biogenesis protein CcmH/NrfF
MTVRAARILAAASLALAAVPVTAQPRDPAAEAQAIFTSVMSPYCPGLLLADCPSAAAFELRADIRRRLDGGESRAAIEQDLYHRYGDVIRAVPPATGWGTVLRAAPAAALALSLGALTWWLSRRRAVDETASAGAADPAIEERLQQELDELP